MVGLRLFLPESWINDPARLRRARVPEDRQIFRSKPEIAVEEIDRIRAAGVRFGCVLANAGYGLSAPFRQALSACGRLALRGSRRIIPSTWRWSFPWLALAGRGCVISRTANRLRPRPCSPM